MGPRRWAFHKPVRARSTLGTLIRRTLMVLLVLGPPCLAAIVGFKIWVDNQTAGLIYMPDDSNCPQVTLRWCSGRGWTLLAALPPCFTTG